jgi:ABC-2 type transport system ATP-binding protein
VVIDHGRLVVHQALAQLIGNSAARSTRVRCSHPDVLAAALEAAGAQVTRGEEGDLNVVGSTPEAIGQIAFDNTVVVHEIQTVSPDLEETFLSLTAGSAEEESSR